MSQAGFTNATAFPSVPTQFTGNSGVAVPAANNLNVITANSTVKFVGLGDTLTQDFANLTTFNTFLGASGSSITSGTANTGLGPLTGATITSGSNNTVIGFACGDAITTSSSNTGVGTGALGSLTTGSGTNVAVGNLSLPSLTTGASNICIGASSGTAYTTNETGNIIIGTVAGTIGESGITRIGGSQTQCYLAGVLNTSAGRVVKVTAPGAYPYATLITDDVIIVDTSAARTINPIGSPVTGTRYTIKDSVGSAAANNITITPTGKNIDGAASFVINSNYGSITIVYNGTEWSVI